MSERKLRLVVVIATFGRAGQVARLVTYLAGQTRQPDEVVISAPDASHVGSIGKHDFPVSLVLGHTGSSVQRNAALSSTLARYDIVTFFDDDFVPANDYLQLVEDAFLKNQDWVVVMGNVVKDGAGNAGMQWDEGLDALKTATEAATGTAHTRVVDHVGAYGCNMSVRSSIVGNTRFDERLVLYGWQEDIDFTSQLRRHGRVVSVSSIRGVHLGLKAGKVSGKRFGYSQVVNPIYLIKKGTVPATFALPLMFRNIAANLVRSLWPESYVDRRGRLWGNLLGIAHVLTGREAPEYVLNL